MTGEPIAAVDELIELIQHVREYVNEARIHAELFADKPQYFRACSAMDMIEDTAQSTCTSTICDGSSARG